MARAASAGATAPRRTRRNNAVSSSRRKRALRRRILPGIARRRRCSRLTERLEPLGLQTLQVFAEKIRHLVHRTRPVHLLAHPCAVGETLDVPGDVLPHLARGDVGPGVPGQEPEVTEPGFEALA